MTYTHLGQERLATTKYPANHCPLSQSWWWAFRSQYIVRPLGADLRESELLLSQFYSGLSGGKKNLSSPVTPQIPFGELAGTLEKPAYTRTSDRPTLSKRRPRGKETADVLSSEFHQTYSQSPHQPQKGLARRSVSTPSPSPMISPSMDCLEEEGGLSNNGGASSFALCLTAATTRSLVLSSYRVEDGDYEDEDKKCLEPPHIGATASITPVSGSQLLKSTNLLELAERPKDDSVVTVQPSRQVDYLSHSWKEEDIWMSWKYVISRRKYNDQTNSARLENASWRTWAKSKSGLRTVSPEALNWYANTHPLSALTGA